MKKLQIAAVLLLILALMSGCSPAPAAPMGRGTSSDMAAPNTGSAAEGEAGAPSAAQPAEAPAADGGPRSQSQQIELPENRMIIRTANMSVLVEDTATTVNSLRELVAAHEGYVADSRQWHSGEQLYANMTLRVPAQSLDQVIAAIGEMVIRVEDETISGQDVTEEYTDIQARLRNLEATETELLALLTEVRENRGDAEEVLAVHQRISEIRGEIEMLKGRSQFLERMTALSTLQITIQPKASPATVVQVAEWSPLVTASEALRALVSLLQVLADIAIYLLILSPVVLVPLAVLWLVVRWLRRKGRKEPQSNVPTAAS